MTGYTSSKIKLTKRVVDATVPRPDADVIVWDTEVIDFRLRVRPSGRKAYEVRYRPKGSRTQRQISIGVHGSPWTVDEARDRAKTILRDVHAGNDPLTSKAVLRESLTVSDLIDVYLAEGPAFKPDKRASAWNVDRYNLVHHLRPLLGRKVARELQTDDLVEWQSKVAGGETAKREPSGKKRGVTDIKGGPGAAAKAIRVVATMLEWARSQGHVPTNVARDVEKIGDGVRERYLLDEESIAVWKAIDALAEEGDLIERLVVAFKLVVLTGARIGEIRGLRWTEVDLQRGLAFLPPARHKSGGRGNVKSLQLPPIAVTILKEFRAKRSSMSHVFPAVVVPPKKTTQADAADHPVAFRDEPMSPPYSQWNRVLRRAGVTDASFHILRHTFASQVMDDEPDIFILSKLLGHARVSTTERYVHLGKNRRADAAEKLARRYSRGSISQSGPSDQEIET